MKNLVTPDEIGLDARFIDCRFSLANPSEGRRAFDTAHIPGAVYADLERDLSGPIVAGHTGRHPLPDPARFAQRAGYWGIGARTFVVAYDDAGGAMAARLWWLLRWLGHDEVAVLDGGIGGWEQSGRAVTSEIVLPEPTQFEVAVQPGFIADVDEVERARTALDWRVFDARSAERFRGENETIDPVAGHIPGAHPLPFADNLRDGRMLPTEQLRKRMTAALDGVPAERAIVYCGSGVTACHDVLAAEIAGLPGMRLYAGSWSEWITDPTRAVAR